MQKDINMTKKQKQFIYVLAGAVLLYMLYQYFQSQQAKQDKLDNELEQTTQIDSGSINLSNIQEADNSNSDIR